MFALWPLGRYGDILGQNHKILLKNYRILGKIYHHFIFTRLSILNLSESSYDKYHRLLFLTFQTRFVYLISHFGAKTADLLRKYVKLLPVNSSVLNHQ
jgi:hypothetical protein